MFELKGIYNHLTEYGWKMKVFLLLATIIIVLYFLNASRIGGDFASYLEAATKMRQGTDIYAPPYVHLRYSYSPFWAMVLIPLSVFSSQTGVFIWLVINVFLLWRTIYLLRNYFDIRFSDRKKDMILWIGVILFMSRFIELNFHHAQMTIFLLLAMLESIRLADEGNEITAGIWIGLSTIIKIMPIVMIPYFIYRRKFRTAIFSLVTLLIAFFLPMIYLGYDRFEETNKEWFQILRPDSSEFQIDNVWYFPHNLSALLYRLLIDTGAPYVKNISSLDYQTATYWVWAAIIGLITLTVFFLASPPFRAIKSRQRMLFEFSYIALIIPLIFPHQMKYAFYLLLPAICCLIKLLMIRKDKKEGGFNYWATIILLGVAFALCTMTTDLLLGMHYSIITQYMKTITIGTLLVIPALALNRRHFVS